MGLRSHPLEDGDAVGGESGVREKNETEETQQTRETKERMHRTSDKKQES